MARYNVDLQSPLAQALISEGQKRGYSPIAIAASIGNASQENGLRTNGAPGDNGTAFGAFQWRGDRYRNLQNTAGAMGKAWDDPSVQAAHWYNEQDGKYGGEKRYGDRLKAAQTPEEANDAVISSLRPAGSQDGPRNAHNYTGRMNAVNEAFGLLGNQGGSPGGTAVAGGPPTPPVNPADLPAEGAQDASFQMPQPAPPKEGWDAFLDGGPGALFGKPQQGWNMGDAMTGAGIALMARDNPAGAAAMAKMLDKTPKKPDDTNDVSTRIDPNSGRAYTYDSKGNVTVKQIHPADAKPITDGAIKMLQGNDSKAETAWTAAEGTRKYTQMLMNGDVDLSALGRMGNNYSNFLNDSDEKTRNAAGLMSQIMRMRDAKLLESKGVQTEGDAQRALDSLLPGSAKYDNKAVASLFRDLTKEFTNTYSQNQMYNQQMLKKYPDYDPDGYAKSRYEERMKAAGQTDSLIEKGWENYMKPPVPTVPTAPQPTGRDPAKSQEKPKSFKSFVYGR